MSLTPYLGGLLPLEFFHLKLLPNWVANTLKVDVYFH